MTAMKTERLSAKLIRREGYHHVPTHAHWCPGCNEMHDYATEQPFANGARWTFDGNNEAPSFTRSMNISYTQRPEDADPGEPLTYRCHYYLTAGKLIFLSDSTHALSGQTVPLPDIPDKIWMYAGIVPDN